MKSVRIPWMVLVAGVSYLLGMGTSCRKERRLDPPKAIEVDREGMLKLRVMTFNVRYENTGDGGARAWSERLLPVVRMIRSERPDVIGIQEAMHGQVADLWASLPEYEFFGAGREDGGRNGEYTGMFHRRAKLEADSGQGGCFWLSDLPGKSGSMTWGNSIPRMVVWRRFTDRSSGRSFRAYNTHWDHLHQGSRVKSALRMREHIEERFSAEEPVVVMGDFNAVESNTALRFLMAGEKGRAPRLLDTFESVHPQERRRTTLHFWRNSRVGSLKVDHILASSGVKVVEAAIRDGDEPMISDHFPVVAELVFSAAKGGGR